MLQAPADNETADEAQTRHIVNILVQLQKQVESNVGLKHVSQSQSQCTGWSKK